MAMQNPPVSQTRSFTTVFMIEMWERFGFYGMQVLMVTFLMKKLGFVDTKANLVWGAAAALIYATPAIGGWVGDKLLGTRRTMLIGATVLAIGYGILWIQPETLGLTDRAYIIYSGAVLMEGHAEDVVNNPDVRRLYLGEEFKL